jgi:hypothetical protein
MPTSFWRWREIKRKWRMSALGTKDALSSPARARLAVPLRIGHIRFAPRHRFDVAGVDYGGDDAHALQSSKWAFPVNAGDSMTDTPTKGTISMKWRRLVRYDIVRAFSKSF